jgi:hypothetical protein
VRSRVVARVGPVGRSLGGPEAKTSALCLDR